MFSLHSSDRRALIGRLKTQGDHYFNNDPSMPPTMIPAFLRWETNSPTVTDPLNPIIRFFNNIFTTQTLNDYNRKGAKGPVLIVNQVETVIIMYASGPLFDRPKIAYLTSKIVESRPLRKWLYEYKQARQELRKSNSQR